MRLSLKLLLISELVLLVAVLVVVVPVWNEMRQQVVADMQRELKAIATTAALQIDGELHRRIRESADADTEAFRTIQAQLRRVQVANGIDLTHIYTFYPDGDRVRFAVMLNPDEELFIGAEYPMQTLMRPVLERGTMEATELYDDENGRWISAYAPIKDADGAIVGLLEVDMESATYFERFYEYTAIAAALGAVALVVSSLLGWWVLQRVVIQPVSVIREGMLALGRRDFQHRVRLTTKDELQDLGETLNDIAHQLDVARMVQQSFFPTVLPEHARYRIAGESVPCDATGGDYFDAFTLEDGRIAILVADVSGHGLGPSLLMAACRSSLRGLSQGDPSPGPLVDRLNHLMIDDLSDGRFITLIFGVLGDDGTLTYANFGHAPAMVVNDDGVHHLDSHQPPLGIGVGLVDGPMESSLSLDPGDRVFFASDGLVEAMNDAGEQLGNAAVEAIVGDRTIPSDVVVRRLHDLLIKHCGGPSTTDDVTMLCVDRV